MVEMTHTAQLSATSGQKRVRPSSGRRRQSGLGPEAARAIRPSPNYRSPKTIRNHVTSIPAKLRATDRAEVIIRARDAGLGTSPGTGEAPA